MGVGKGTAVVAGALVLLLMVSARLDAADHYVSQSGSAAWSACVSTSTPCSPTTAFANAAAGDTVYFRGGTYHPAQSTGDSPALPAYRPLNSGRPGNPITFKAYPGESAIIDAYAQVGPNGQLADFCFGIVDRNYVTFDGFTLIGNGGAAMGGAYMWHSTGSVFRNLTINGGSAVQTTTDNCDCVRIEYCTNYTVQNCKIFNFRQATNWPNTAGIKLYHNTNAAGLAFGYSDVYGVGVIENCEFYNGVAPIYVKSSTDDLTIRNNFIHDCAYGVHVTPSLAVMQSDRGSVYNNLIVSITVGNGFDSNDDNGGFHGNDWVIYNNTFYDVAGGAFSFSAAQAGHGWKYYNNISHVSKATYDLSAENLTSLLTEEDHNQWGTGSIGFEYGRNSGYYRYSSLAAWQATTWLEGGGHPGGSDLASDPLFVNTSGTLSQRADFVLASNSPCKGAGRNGADLGALNIATSVGYSDLSKEPPAGPGPVIIKVP
jgi:Right handed beta helix region